MEFLNQILNTARVLAETYNLNVGWFLLVYFSSFIPFYLGYFLILYGSSRRLTLKDILHLRLKHAFSWTTLSTWGLVIHLFGRVMPYAFIVFLGRNLPAWVYILIVLIFGFSTYYLVKKLFLTHNNIIDHGLLIESHETIRDPNQMRRLWEIYGLTFEEVNRQSPCKQSFDHNHFIEALSEPTIIKYLLIHPQDGAIGLAMVTNDFKNTTWISPDYFKTRFPRQFSEHSIYYFMGLAIHKNYHGNRYSLKLIEHVIDDIPHHAIMGFDHSHNVNPLLHYFTKVVRQARSIKRTHIDRQHYHIVERV